MIQDRFFEVTSKYMLPIERLERVIDSSYFLRKNLSFVFAQGYCHPRGGFYGKLINYPKDDGPLNIFGRRYATTNKRLIDGRLELIPIDEQLEIHHRIEEDMSKNNTQPPFTEYHTRFRIDDCLGYFDHKHSLEVALEMYQWLPEKIKKISEFVELPMERFGVTGSLAYGKMEPEHEDVDITLYGSVDEHTRLLKKIEKWLENSENRVFEFGKFWPMRFFYEQILVCPFFIYDHTDEMPLADFEMDLLKERISFRGRVSDDTHSIYLPIVLLLENLRLGGDNTGDMPIIIYDSSQRGEFKRGDRVEGHGKLVNVRKPKEEFTALLVTIGTAINKT